MKFTTVQPVIQVAELASPDDVQWLLDCLKNGTPFQSVRVEKLSFRDDSYETIIYDDSLTVRNDQLVKVSYESGYGNSVDRVESIVAKVGMFVAWNQEGVAHMVSVNYNQRFNKSMIPEALLMNVVVELPSK